MKVASIGNLNFDIYLRISELPGPDVNIEALDLYTGGGGSAANFAVAIARMGLGARFIGAVGDDPLGDISLRELLAEGVEVAVKRVTGVRSGVVVVLVHPDGIKRMVSFRGANLGLTPTDLTPDKFEGVNHIHLATGRTELITKAKEIAREVGASVSVDGGTALARKGLEIVRATVEGVDVVFMNHVEAKMLANTGDHRSAVEKLAKELKVGELVVTLGPLGAVAYRGGKLLHVDAFKVAALDTTGAGDSFAAAYIAMHLRGRDLYEKLLFANAAAAIKVTRPGARSSPRYDEVRSFLESLGYKI
ncbi:MAG: carbohydrate kinase family protein [Pyrobaculum sp.]|uniref:carbohydrate kinase family protein n=1 Tax=Pyrobaculum sp. TaxID=2004705 RepID=UPI003176B5AB